MLPVAKTEWKPVTHDVLSGLLSSGEAKNKLFVFTDLAGYARVGELVNMTSESLMISQGDRIVTYHWKGKYWRYTLIDPASTSGDFFKEGIKKLL
jgi:hypothetical protein